MKRGKKGREQEGRRNSELQRYKNRKTMRGWEGKTRKRRKGKRRERKESLQALGEGRAGDRGEVEGDEAVAHILRAEGVLETTVWQR